ncbi:MAG: hypothetical protein ACK4ON_00680, partial [Bacteroidia bacterium]
DELIEKEEIIIKSVTAEPTDLIIEEEVKTIVPETKQPTIVGKIDLDALNKPKRGAKKKEEEVKTQEDTPKTKIKKAKKEEVTEEPSKKVEETTVAQIK